MSVNLMTQLISDSYLYPICKEPMPLEFSNPDEASLQLEVVTAKVFDCFDSIFLHAREELGKHRDLDELDDDAHDLLVRATIRTVDLDAGLLEDLDESQRALEAWMFAFSAIPLNPSNRISHTSAQIFYFCVWIWTKTWLDATSMLIDRFEPQFEYFTQLCEQFVESHTAKTPLHSDFLARSGDDQSDKVKTPPAFSLGSGVVTCLVAIVERCRNSSIRRRCIATLRKINLQGIFDTDYLITYLTAIFEHEEQAASFFSLQNDSAANLQARDIPEAARLLEVAMSPSYHCLNPGFYKGNTVKLVFVTRICGDVDGELQVGEKVVAVNRAAR